jgi:hypothetical protein
MTGLALVPIAFSSLLDAHQPLWVYVGIALSLVLAIAAKESKGAESIYSQTLAPTGVFSHFCWKTPANRRVCLIGNASSSVGCARQNADGLLYI